MEIEVEVKIKMNEETTQLNLEQLASVFKMDKYDIHNMFYKHIIEGGASFPRNWYCETKHLSSQDIEKALYITEKMRNDDLVELEKLRQNHCKPRFFHKIKKFFGLKYLDFAYETNSAKNFKYFGIGKAGRKFFNSERDLEVDVRFEIPGWKVIEKINENKLTNQAINQIRQHPFE